MGSPPGHRIEDRRQVKRVAMNANRIPTLLVGEENDNIGFVCGWHGILSPDLWHSVTSPVL
ncbi:MAG: hypothetical protein Kow0099_27360 [Candidatus Abyssubacteria bacterium]